MKHFKKKGGGLSILGDVFAAGADPSGRDFADFLTGPMGGDLKSIFGLTAGNMMQWYEGKDTNAANEAFKLVKNKIPAQNLWYTKAAINRMFFDELQDVVAPGYREKLLRKAEREQGRTRWWGDDFNDVQSPDFVFCPLRGDEVRVCDFDVVEVCFGELLYVGDAIVGKVRGIKARYGKLHSIGVCVS